MAIELLIPGQPDVHAKDRLRGAGGTVGTNQPPSTDLLQAVETVDAYTLSAAARARTVEPKRVAAAGDDVLEIEVEGGFTLWTSVERYRHDAAVLRPETVRGGTLRIDTLPRASVTERGVRDWVASALRILRLRDDAIDAEMADPARWREFARDAGLSTAPGRPKQARAAGRSPEAPLSPAVKAGAWLTTKFVLWLIERRLPYGEGLYRFGDVVRSARGDGVTPPVPLQAADVDAAQPILVFVHGTASTTEGSFGALLDAAAATDWRALQSTFGGRIYGFEHRTMSASPVQNAIRLLEALPAGARVSLVTHSRGGMVGDLLCLPALGAEAIGLYTRRDAALAEADEFDRRHLQTLAELLQAKALKIDRVLRCACPARGTLLASDNTDQFLSVLTNLVGLIPGLAGSPLYEVVKRITLQTAKNRWDPAQLPGIEAMTPTSPLVQLLNTQRDARGELGVVAGDIEGGHWLQRLGAFITDQFIYENRDNDLVVNTDSMFEGAVRKDAYYVFDQGGDVTHFNYFRNERTRGAMQRWLTAAGSAPPPEFRPLEEDIVAPVPMHRALQKRAGAAQPMVFVLPGVMGSQLARDDDRIWLHFLRLAAGGLADLHDVAGDAVRPIGLIGQYYRGLCEYLADTHQVHPFAYDWRRDIATSAADLAEAMSAALDRHPDQPVRFVAHSMGGLVVRRMIKDAPQLWDRVCAREGGRFVMLGTPNRGSHSMVDALLGTAGTVQQLAMLDLTRGLAGVLDIIQDFPGVLTLLPLAEDGRWFARNTWDQIRAAAGQGARPDPALLSRARSTLAGLPEQIPHAERVLYVAGNAPQTVIGAEVVEGQIVLSVTSEGDGKVTWASGRLPGVLTWYLDAEHGDLPAVESAFPAVLELLQAGTTTRLPATPPGGARGITPVVRTLPQRALYPTEAELTAGLMGLSGKHRAQRYRARSSAGFRASVVHGDLRYAKYPIVVGHYEGDTIVGAEARIDQLLDGALSTRYNLGVYPGQGRNAAVVLRQPNALQRALRMPTGAVVVSLGRWGELTAAQLANLIRSATLAYVLQLDESTAEGRTSSDVVGLSILLIGTNSTSNISIDDSVSALLRGVAQANRELASRVPGARGVGDVEIIELYADAAIAAARALKQLAVSLSVELDTRIEAAPLLTPGRNGRARLTAMQGREPWRRWEISVVEAPVSAAQAAARLPKPLADRLRAAVTDAAGADKQLLTALAQLALGDAAGPAPHRELRFVSLSDRARAEVMQLQRQPELVERLIAASVGDTRFRIEEARALFELIVPNDLKDGLSQLSRVVFVVDAETAAYPWELMTDGKEPLATRLGLIRQLKTATFRPHIRATTARTAYIVGDPIVSAPYVQLAGAREEARLVAQLLGQRFEPTYRDEALGALDVLAGLYEQPYRVIHLAGHGYYEAPGADGSARSGMVLDNGVYLTAVEIGQMQQVPELVFLNCCHLGQVGGEAPRSTPTTPYNRLAASISRELIEMGVRAVVAAGWAVRDDAALEFARVFYEQMLEGQTFGRALQEARRRCWQQFPDCNTWGAYQAYGDPDFRFDADAGAAARAGSLRDYVAAAEFIDLLRDSRQVAREIARGERKGEVAEYQASATQRIAELMKDCPAEWLARSEVQVELGLTYGELAGFEQAARHLSAALASDEPDSATTLAAVEQLANFESRLGVRLATAKEADADQRGRGAERIEMAISRLTTLGQLGHTAERLSLLAGCYKNLAQIRSDRDEIRLALEQGARHYEAAHQWNLQRGRFDPYPVLNWLSLATILGQTPDDLDTKLAEIETAARERYARSRGFFDAATFAEAKLVRALAGAALFGEAARVRAEVEHIADLYAQAARAAHATARQIDSVTTQLDTLARMLQALAPPRDRDAAQAAEALRAIRALITGEAATKEDEGRAPQAHKTTPRAAKKTARTTTTKTAKKAARRTQGKRAR